MKIIYDEAKAMTKWEVIEAANHRAKILTISSSVCLLILLIVLGIGALVFNNSFCTIALMPVFLCCAIFSSFINFGYTFEDKYPQDVKYYLAVKGKKVLDHIIEFNPCGDNSYLSVVTESEDHTVKENTNCCILHKVKNTEILEDTVDLEKGIVMVPYPPIAEELKHQESPKTSPEISVLDPLTIIPQTNFKIEQEGAQKVVEHVQSTWSRDFLNPAGWCPEIKEREGILIVDGYPVCPVKDVKEVSCDLTNLYLITDTAKYTLHVHQSMEGSPEIDDLDVSKIR